eukprot:TRINITY_DN110245_c0_g1_i1.p1 TRINITY_DN110245_c0_g1~~TRINITY_DN110245_c0_g1_i1.p1  ORF type:complete len:351 (-),score=76.84 TRINITY_DN110245_c0_g1_i1:129-1115(-)
MSSSHESAVDKELQAKVDEKIMHVQSVIRNVEKACLNNTEEDRQWLSNIIDPKNPVFATLVKLLIQSKYKAFTSLHCVALRAIQMILRIASQLFLGSNDADIGMRLFVELSGQELASEAWPEICRMAEQQEEPLVACNALIVLAELGPKAFCPELVGRLMEVLQALPDRAADLIEVALRVHAWGGKAREALVNAAVQHPGGKLLCEVLLQVVNRCDAKRRLRAVKIFTSCLSISDGGDSLLYTNDARVLVEILQRELPIHAEDATAFGCLAECYKVLAIKCEAARSHRRTEALQVFEDLREDERLESQVREKCSEVLAILEQPPTGLR